ncbi:hypothetical protein NEHOM01_0420 [Nematocida homosporus]|uniref:uncharacterized protein n=1 Tax=Nematocida homosporus TaxID=1912981 RepID=UPI00221EB890|nr:uncharacterized protein NEHOM01_0420 [Nematocida homosporus]KAI5184818.1 hypothetical protein NEHOM01_0420 [Nematocida homosporus]
MRFFSTSKHIKLYVFFGLCLLLFVHNAMAMAPGKVGSGDNQVKEAPDTLWGSFVLLLSSIFGFAGVLYQALYVTSMLYSPTPMHIGLSIGVCLLSVVGLYSLVKSEMPRAWTEIKAVLGYNKSKLEREKLSAAANVQQSYIQSLNRIEKGQKTNITQEGWTKFVISTISKIIAFMMMTVIIVSVLRTAFYFFGLGANVADYMNWFSVKDMMFPTADGTLVGLLIPAGTVSYIGVLKIINLVASGPIFIMGLGIITTFAELFKNYYKVDKSLEINKVENLKHANRTVAAMMLFRCLIYGLVWATGLNVLIFFVDPLFNYIRNSSLVDTLLDWIKPPGTLLDYEKDIYTDIDYTKQKRIQKVLTITSILLLVLFSVFVVQQTIQKGIEYNWYDRLKLDQESRAATVLGIFSAIFSPLGYVTGAVK